MIRPPTPILKLTIRCIPYFSDHKAHFNLSFFSKMEHAPYSPVRLMCGSGCALSSSSEEILCFNNCYQRNSTFLNSFFLESKLLNSLLQSNDLLSFPLRVCIFSSPTLVSFTMYLSLHFMSVNTHMRRACIAT